MPLLRRPLPSLLLLALLASLSVAVMASPQQGERKHGRGDQQQAQHQPDTKKDHGRNDDAMSDSIRRVERATGGQVLSAERVPYEGRSVNRIKVVDGRGRVRVYTDDPTQSTGTQSDARPPRASQSNGSRSKSRQGKRPTRDDDD